MTGYGRGTSEVGGRRFVVELRTVNHRFLEIKMRLPFSDPAVEAQVAQAVRAKLDRGVVNVSVREEGAAGPGKVRADLAVARGYAAALEEVRAALDLSSPVTLELIAAQPGVLQVGEGVEDSDALFSAMRPGLEAALARLVETRTR